MQTIAKSFIVSQKLKKKTVDRIKQPQTPDREMHPFGKSCTFLVPTIGQGHPQMWILALIFTAVSDAKNCPMGSQASLRNLDLKGAVHVDPLVKSCMVGLARRVMCYLFFFRGYTNPNNLSMNSHPFVQIMIAWYIC